ncbi:MAG: hypothetical protein HYZ08_00190 [Candidatus Kerfeldbacteria bacterium]|nr:hypothetical protein [Candidatus Kerfeldbacteria bacterium]
MAGLGRILAIASNPNLIHSATWGMIGKVLRTGIPVQYHEIMLMHPSRTPSILKVDLMETTEGFRIAEIDGHNKHGLGYSTLAARIRRAVMPDAEVFSGVAAALAAEVRRRGENRVVLLYARQEQFYLPEFRILQAELQRLGVELVVVEEQEVRMRDGRVVTRDGADCNLFVDFPFFYHNPPLNALLVSRYRSGEIDFLIPPKPFLGSKAVLALLRNDLGDEELEAILKSQIPAASLRLLRQYIPTTYLIYKRKEGREFWDSPYRDIPFVLKESISNGMKGTVFEDDPHFQETMGHACGSYYRYILQQEVTNRPQEFSSFTPDGRSVLGEWYTRVTVHFAVRRVADIVVTARQDKKVHGAPDCLQIGAVIV